MTDPSIIERSVDVLIVGAGPAGLSTALELRRVGVTNVEVLEREKHAGGIPRHSAHLGYGLRDLHRFMDGPTYARRRTQLAVEAGVRVRTGVTATGWAGPQTIDVSSSEGLERITAGAIVLATGARERPRAARLVAGSRPHGVFTTGHLQQAAEAGQSIGQRAIIVGAEHVSYSAAMTLHHAGVEIAAMITDLPRAQSYLAFRLGARWRFRFPVLVESRVTQIIGRKRVEGVEVQLQDGSSQVIDCDTVVFTGDWIPDHELARRGDLELDPGTRGPSIDTQLSTSRPGVFAVGNLVRGVETADQVAREGRSAARSAANYLRASDDSQSVGVAIEVRHPLLWVAPNRIAGDAAPPLRHFVLWSKEFRRFPRVVVRQGGVIVHSRRRRSIIPNRPIYLRASWLAKVDVAGSAVTIDIV